MVATAINLDVVPLFFFFFLYSVLEILVARTMEDYRLIEFEEEFEDEEDVDDEDYDGGEYEEESIPEGITLPSDSNLIFSAGEEDGDDDEEEEEDEEEDYEEEEEEELFPVARMIPRGLIEDDDYEDEDLEEDNYEEEEMEELITADMASARVSNLILHGRRLQGAAVINNDLRSDSNDSELCDGNPGNQELNRGEIEGLYCPICFEAWTSSGYHQICCLPCGHIYGLSCIKKWLQQGRSSGKCPQCNSLCTSNDIRVLYTTRLCVADEELQKRVQSLEAKCASLEQKAAPLMPEELIDQICSNPTLMQRLAAAIAELQQQQEDQPQVFH